MLDPQSYVGVFREILPRAGRFMLPMLILAVLSGLIGGAIASHAQQYWMLGVSALLILVIVLTFLMIVPLNAELLSNVHISGQEIQTIRERWATWHGARTAFSMAALTLAMVGMSWR